MNKITSYEDIISENIHKTNDEQTALPVSQHLSNYMKIKDSIGVRKLQLNKSAKRLPSWPYPEQGETNVMSTTKLTQNRHNRTQRINVIKIKNKNIK